MYVGYPVKLAGKEGECTVPQLLKLLWYDKELSATSALLLLFLISINNPSFNYHHQYTSQTNSYQQTASLHPFKHTHIHTNTQPTNKRTTMIPKAREFSRSTGVIVGVAGTASAAPLLFFLPGAHERLAAQAAKWGPRWERGFSRVSPTVQRVNTRVEPKMKKGVQVVEPPLKGAAM